MYLRVASKAARPKGRKRQLVDDAAQDAVRRVETWLRLEQERRQYTGQSGRVDAVVESGGGRSGYSYDEDGNLIEIAETNGQRRHYAYDEQRRLTNAYHLDGTVTTYTYGDNDRLAEVNDRGTVTRYGYDQQGRVTRINQGRTGAVIYRYDEAGRVAMARTPRVSTAYGYDAQGRMIESQQSIDGVSLTLRLAYDYQGRLETMTLPGSRRPIRYHWDSRGRPLMVSLGDSPIASFSYEGNVTKALLGNGIAVEAASNSEDGRPASQAVTRGSQTLFEQRLTYNTVGEVISDGDYCYAYDILGRLAEARDSSTGKPLRYAYDCMDNRTLLETEDISCQYRYDANSRLKSIDSERVSKVPPLEKGRLGGVEATPSNSPFSRGRTGFSDAGKSVQPGYDRHGRMTQKSESGESWAYRYDDAGQLTQVMRQGQTIARFAYDHKGRLALAEFQERAERYIYSPSDELLAVTDANGSPLRLFVRTPLGPLAEVHGSLDSGDVFYLHSDARGATRLVTDKHGKVAASFSFDPFGLPTSPQYSPSPCTERGPGGEVKGFVPQFGGHVWHPEVGLYYCGARWYDPALGRFMTPDTFTGSPDDARLVNPIIPSSRQSLTRTQLLGGWLKQPRLRNSYVYCSNDPVGRVDPDGHWSFGGVLLTLLGVIWTLPNTLIGLFLEITCLVGEVLRWLVWLITFGNVSWQTPGFDAAASGRLNAFALVFEGGWFGSLPLLGMTFGNVFFVSDDWEDNPATGGPGDVFPDAYQGRVAIPRREALYGHELRHTNQYGWFGPIYFIAFLIDRASSSSSCDMWLERDARRFAGL